MMTIKDILIRSFKSAIASFIGTMGAVGIGWLEVDALQAAGIVGLTAGGTVLINAIYNWSRYEDASN